MKKTKNITDFAVMLLLIFLAAAVDRKSVV